MIKVIVFDFGGVLGSDADEWKTTFKKIPKMTGLTPAVIQEIFEKHWTKLKLGKESLSKFWEEIIKASSENIRLDRLNQIYLSSVIIHKGIFNYARKLKKRGYRLIILANESKEGIRNKIKRFDLHATFDKIYCSALIGLAKPDLKLFKYVLSDLKIKPQETIFIDNQLNNIIAARSIGIKSIIFKNSKQLRKQLSHFSGYL